MAEIPRGDVLWRPTDDYLSRSNLSRFMGRHGISDYSTLLRKSIENIEWFWDAALKDLGVEWHRPYDRLLDDSGGFPWCRWFTGGQVNIVHNCVDRHARTRPDETAILWEGDGGETRRMTYAELDRSVCRTAAALRRAGIDRGDVVGFFMPMVPELIVAYFATLKLGAVALPVFSAFGPEALAFRLQDAAAKALFTADGSYRRGQEISIKANADSALLSVPTVRTVIVYRRTGGKTTWVDGRDVW